MLCPTLINVGRSKKSRFAQIGDGKNLFDYTYIENVAHAHLVAADKLTPGSSVGGQAYFITNDEPIPFWDLPKRIWRDLDCPLPIFPLPKFLMFWIFFFLDFVLKSLYPVLKKNPMFLQMVRNRES
jgi:nucleoside-diphosphate-sugar epimerase